MGIFQQFPYSNFHEMNLDEIIKIVKNMVEEWAQYYNTWDNWKEQVTTEWEEMRSFINNYFDNLNVQTEINNKITDMVRSGEFSLIVDPYVPPAVADWLADHITTPETVVIDDSLTIEGAAADAKATGDAIAYVEDDFSDFNYSIGNGMILNPDNANPNPYFSQHKFSASDVDGNTTFIKDGVVNCLKLQRDEGDEQIPAFYLTLPLSFVGEEVHFKAKVKSAQVLQLYDTSTIYFAGTHSSDGFYENTATINSLVNQRVRIRLSAIGVAYIKELVISTNASTAFYTFDLNAIETEIDAKTAPIIGNVKLYGAVGDGVTDDTTAFVNCFNNNNCIIIPAGTYLIRSNEVNIGSDVTVIGNGATITEVTQESDPVYYLFNIMGDNVNISNLKIIGDLQSTSIGGEYGHGFYIRSGSNRVNISNCEISYFHGDGLVSHATDGKYSNLTIHHCYRNGITVVGDDTEINNCYIHHIQGTAPQQAICIEPDVDKDLNCVINNIVSESNFGGCIDVQGSNLKTKQWNIVINNVTSKRDGHRRTSSYGPIVLRNGTTTGMLSVLIKNMTILDPHNYPIILRQDGSENFVVDLDVNIVRSFETTDYYYMVLLLALDLNENTIDANLRINCNNTNDMICNGIAKDDTKDYSKFNVDVRYDGGSWETLDFSQIPNFPY